MTIRAWLDERTGWPSAVDRWLSHPVPGGPRLAYAPGSVLVFLLIVQALTGALLASAYSPSTSAAWASVAFVQNEMRLGWLIRGLHAWGASAMVALAALHLVLAAALGAHRKPREITWLLGLTALLVLLALALTGYLLPWDQRGYWATQVVTSLVGALPLLGRSLQHLLVGGESYGNLTLVRFYALHAMVLPAGIVLLVALHVALFRRHGPTPGHGRGRARADEPFWPGQAVRDLAAIAVVWGAVWLVVLTRHGVSLEAPADPSSAYAARPEWFFRPLFVALKLLPPGLETAGAALLPLLCLGLLAALPFVDDEQPGSPASVRRWPRLVLVAAPFVCMLGLGLFSWWSDAGSPAFQAERREAELQSKRALVLARQGVLAAGGLAVFDNDPAVVARRLFRAHCSTCHELGGQGERSAPRLDGWASRPWSVGVMKDPDAVEYYGTSGVSGMKRLMATDDQLADLAESLFAEGGVEGNGAPVDQTRRARGQALLVSEGCSKCHAMDGRTAGDGPNLAGWGSAAWAKAFLRDPGALRFYGKQNRMPRMSDRLGEGELDALARLLAAERLAKTEK